MSVGIPGKIQSHMSWQIHTLVALSLMGCDGQKGSGGSASGSCAASASKVQASVVAESLRKLEAEIDRLDREIQQYNELAGASALRLALEPSSEAFPAFMGAISIGKDGIAKIAHVFFGRAPADFASYVEKPSPGLYLTGRLIGSAPSTASPPYSERFCYRIEPDGEVVGLNVHYPLNIRTVIEKLGARHEMNPVSLPPESNSSR